MYLPDNLAMTCRRASILVAALSCMSKTAVAVDVCNVDTMDSRKVDAYEKALEEVKNPAGKCYIAGNARGADPGQGVVRFASEDQLACEIADPEYHGDYEEDWAVISEPHSSIGNSACLTENGKFLLRTGEYDASFSISSTLAFKGQEDDQPDRNRITYSSIPGTLLWLPEKRSPLKLVKSANTARTISIDWMGFELYGSPKIQNIIFQGNTVPDLKVFPVSTDSTISTVTASSNDKLNTSGEMEIVIGNDFNESASLFIDVSFFTFKDDPNVLSLKMELSLTRKLIADEMFIKAGDIEPLSTPCPAGSPGAASGAAGYCDILNQYLLAENDLPDCGTKGEGRAQKQSDDDKVDCSALTEAELATLKLIRSDISYRLILLENVVPFLGGYRSLKQTTPHQELIKLQSLEQRMSDLVDNIRDVQWRTTDLQIKSAETEAGRAYSMGQAKSQQITSGISEIASVNFDADIASNRQHLVTLASHIADLDKRADNLEKQQDALEAKAGSLIQQGIAAASGLPVQEVEMLASGDIEGAVEAYVMAEVKKQGSEMAKKFAENNEMVQSVTKAYEDFKKAEEEIRSAVDEVTKIPQEIKAAREKLERELRLANEAITGLRDDIGGEILENFAGAAGGRMRKEVEQMVEQLKPIGLRIEAAHKKMMEEGYPTDLRESFEEGLLLISRKVNATEKEWDAIRDNLIKDVQAGLMDHEKRFLSIRLVQVIRSEVRNNRKGLRYLQGLISLYPELVDGADGKFLEDLINKYGGNDKDKNSIYALRKAILNGIETHSGINRQRPDVYFDDGENAIVFRVGLRLSRNDAYQRIPIDDVTKLLLKDFDEAIERLPSEVEIEGFFRNAKDNLDEHHLFVIKNSMKGPEEFARQMQVTMGDNRRELEEAWEDLNEKSGSIFNHKDVLRAPREAVTTLLAMRSYERTQDALPPLKSPTQMQPGETGSDGMSPEANAALGAALNYAYPGAGIALQLGQTYASMEANNDLLVELEKESVRALAEYQQTQKAIRKATIDSAIAKKEQERAEALAEAAEAQLRHFDVVMQIALNEKMELRELLAMYRPYFFYLSEMMRERFNAFDRSLAIWSYGKPSDGFFAKKIMEDPRNVRLALDSEIHLFDWLNREREATKTDPYYLFNHWQQIITLAETYCADYGCKPGDTKLGKIAATVPVSLVRDIGGASVFERFEEWKSLDDRSQGFSFPVNLNGMENLIPRDFLNVRLIDINIIPVTKRGEYLRGNMVNVKHTGSARITALDRNSGELTVFEENLLPAKAMPPSNEHPFNLTALAERFQTQTDLNSLLSLRGFEGYGALGSYEFNILDVPGIERVSDFEIQIAYVYQEASDITSEQDYLNKIEASCRDQETQNNGDWDGSDIHRNDLKVVMCVPKLHVQFKEYSINQDTGAVTCGSKDGIRLDVTDQNHMSVVTSILDGSAREGILKCAELKVPRNHETKTVFDLSAIARNNPRCTLVEILNAAGNSSDRKSKCFGEAL